MVLWDGSGNGILSARIPLDLSRKKLSARLGLRAQLR